MQKVKIGKWLYEGGILPERTTAKMIDGAMFLVTPGGSRYAMQEVEA